MACTRVERERDRLGTSPRGFSIELDLGCDPATTDCSSASPEERFTSGFRGTIEYAGTTGGLNTSYCVSVAETPSAPHTVIHSLSLYAPTFLSTN